MSRRLAAAVVGSLGICALGIACGGEESIAPPNFDAGVTPPPPADDAGTDASSNPRACAESDLPDCRVGKCAVTASKGALAKDTKLTLAQLTLPAELTGDAIGNVVCELQLPAGSTATFSLAITLDAPAPTTGTLFRHAPPDAPVLVSSTAKGSVVEGLVTASGTFGVTQRPEPWRVEASVDPDPVTSVDTPTRVRNITSGAMVASYFDGAHLFVGSGSRVLIYNGLPAGPQVAPAVVLGQPDLDSNVTGISSALFGAGVTGIWSDGQKLAVSTGSRVLIWNAIPTKSFTPADLVLGQPDFSTTTQNTGGLSASTLAGPRAIDGDGTRLMVADTFNNRVLVWNTFPQSIGQPASIVLGQPSFTQNDILAPPANLYQAWGATFDGAGGAFVSSFFSHTVRLATNANNPVPDFEVTPWAAAQVRPNSSSFSAGVARLPGGGLAVADQAGPRIAVFRTQPTTDPLQMDFALGQPDTTRGVTSQPTSSTFMNGGVTGPTSITSGGGRFVVSDYYRVLVWDSPPAYNFDPATRVIGQPGFTTNEPGIDYRRISASTLGYPADVAVDGTRFVVADRGNNRVLVYPLTALGTTNPAATVVLGQPDDKSFVPNFDQVTPSAARLNGPGGVALASGHLVVADTENHRVLIWNNVPATSGAPADLVLGQADFAGHRPNRGRGDQNGDGFSDAAADGFFAPTGVATDGTHLFVADRLNHRVLAWDTFPTTNGQAADRVIGQASFTDVLANRGLGGYSASPSGFNLPTGLFLSGTTLWVADTENNRVVRIDDVNGSPTLGQVLGQADGSTVGSFNYQPLASANAGLPITVPTTQSSVNRPRGVTVAGGRVYVSETASSRVHVFDANNGASLAVLGQTNDTTGTENTGGVYATKLARPMGLVSDGTRLLVADSANHRVLGWSLAGPPGTGEPATMIVGQTSGVSNGFNQALASSAGGGTRPRALARSGNELFAVESNHHRVVVRDVPITASSTVKRILGQPNDTLVLPNAGGAPSARSLNDPRGIFVDATRIVIADTGNNRVLVFDRNAGPDAILVLGQADFTSAGANRAGAPSAGTMRAPEGVFVDGARLLVADTGNHRVLVWNTIPTTNGQAADLVLGQAAPGDVLPNRGAAAPTASSMFSPVGLDVVKGALFVADAGNNRVLRFASIPTASGAAATNALGQADLVSRAATADASDKTHLAGPTALADDGTNLYVTDRDLGRVVIYALPGATSGAAATTILGNAGGALLRAPQGVAADRTPLFTSRVYVSDTNGDRLLVLGSVSRLLGE